MISLSQDPAAKRAFEQAGEATSSLRAHAKNQRQVNETKVRVHCSDSSEGASHSATPGSPCLKELSVVPLCQHAIGFGSRTPKLCIFCAPFLVVESSSFCTSRATQRSCPLTALLLLPDNMINANILRCRRLDLERRIFVRFPFAESGLN